MTDAKYRNALPQLDGSMFVTDGGLETTLIFHDGIDIPLFAAFALVSDGDSSAAMMKYFRSYADIAKRHKAGLLLETATWRASADWGDKLGYSADALAQANRDAVDQVGAIREQFEDAHTPVVISGCLGPRGDGYVPGELMSDAEAEAYHATQIATLADAGADLITVMTMNYVEEAVGVARAATAAGMPVVVSFTTETDGRLPTGQPLGEAVEQVDACGAAPAYFMVNCAHPTHFASVLSGPWTSRIRGVRANASVRSHAELDEAEDLDAGDPVELGGQYTILRDKLPQLNVLGGCCGTDDRHIAAIAEACAPLF